LGVGLVVEHAGPAAPGNTHAWARDVRYDAGVALAQRNDAALAVAHTETDQLETILYRLASSPGRRALLGMAVRRGRIVRPLLAARVTRAETEAFCRENGLSWRDDASNLDPSYARTRVREQLLPAFLAVDDRARENVLRTAELLRAEGEVLDELVETFLAGRDHVGRDELRALSPALARLVIRTLAERVTGSGGARAASRIDDVLALDEGLLDLGDGARVEVRRGTVRFISSPSG
ncbi:MAG TPA: tRNA lysidine(34) synthetase, partial [Baekduia sp.]|nr:tRNA lysidine(34) synthetase [Baekduia sp.]